jgi:hypothetical protein
MNVNQLLEKATIQFWRHARITASNQCCLWKGFTLWDGYGDITIWITKHRRRHLKAHVVSWVVHHPQDINLLRRRSTRSKKLVLHSCDKPSCVNPRHLWIGSQKENVLDMDNKSRRGTWDLSGSKNPMWGKTHTLRARRNIIKKLTGRKASLATRAKQRAAHKRYWENLTEEERQAKLARWHLREAGK